MHILRTLSYAYWFNRARGCASTKDKLRKLGDFFYPYAPSFRAERSVVEESPTIGRRFLDKLEMTIILYKLYTKNDMKKIILLLCLLLCCAIAHAQKKTVKREYIYTANEEDSKVTARTFAERQLKNDLLREVGEFLQVEQELKKQSVTANGKEEVTEDFSQKIMAITAGVVEMKILNEVWNGKTYYMLAEMTVDKGEVNRRIKEVLNDKQKTKELEEMRKRATAAEAEAVRLRKELAQANNKNNAAHAKNRRGTGNTGRRHTRPAARHGRSV